MPVLPTFSTKGAILKPDIKLAAVCGLFCPACRIYLATMEGGRRLEEIATRHNLTVDEVRCHGCRSEKRFPFCETCKMYACSVSRGIGFCGECSEYPCEELKQFQAARPHRLELWEAQRTICESGMAKWYGDMTARFSCPDCGTLNSAYDIRCRSCGREPGNAFTGRNRKAIEEYLGGK